MHKFNHDFSCILAIFAVSLFTREWIEIQIQSKKNRQKKPSPSLRGSGLKLLVTQNKKAYRRLPLYEGVD